MYPLCAHHEPRGRFEHAAVAEAGMITATGYRESQKHVGEGQRTNESKYIGSSFVGAAKKENGQNPGCVVRVHWLSHRWLQAVRPMIV